MGYSPVRGGGGGIFIEIKTKGTVTSSLSSDSGSGGASFPYEPRWRLQVQELVRRLVTHLRMTAKRWRAEKVRVCR